MRDREEQGAGRDDRIAIAIFAGNLDGAWHARTLLQVVARDEARVVTGAAGDDVNALHQRQNAARSRAERGFEHVIAERSEEHTSELQSLMRISYAVFCLQKTTTH